MDEILLNNSEIFLKIERENSLKKNKNVITSNQVNLSIFLIILRKFFKNFIKQIKIIVEKFEKNLMKVLKSINHTKVYEKEQLIKSINYNKQKILKINQLKL